ncbi:hypothetical protein AKJ37_02360 [candidate division MSBL1 archaeon SCGC-AAA259I09]|uniref:Shikimate kinase n=1 Tax=candidate division MSBL1 archaeon SCGC-AAA259I09 TaxID=1698267 RepID=A0A133UUD2_9EURY|nr:hypothetical protein AKJ37_02360 [candidate division MSBL1 archaeon SCGC-AAA259I09]
MRGIASACGSATIINAISTGRGSAFAIDLKIRSEVDLREETSDVSGRVGETSEDPRLIETCVEKVLEFFDVRGEFGADVETSADLPLAVGLSSSSAAANATVLATAAALERELDDEKAIELGIESAFEAGTTVTGAYDDAAASFYGGGVVTDNRKRSLLKKFSMDPELSVLIFVPPQRSYTSEEDFRRTEIVDELVDLAVEEALSDNFFGAQTLNGLLYCSVLDHDPQPALEALEAGAYGVGLSGTGPSIVAVCDEDKVGKIGGRWERRSGDIIETKPSEIGARIENE